MTVTVEEEKPFDWRSIESMLPPTRGLFLGRQAELNKVRANLDKASSITALSGVAGCGKSHLAREAAYQWKCDAPEGEHRIVLFVNASSERSSHVSVLEIIKRLGLQPVFQEGGKAIPTKELARRMYSRIAEAPLNVKVLVILDDAPSCAVWPDLLNEWFGLASDRFWSNKSVIVTSQSGAYSDETSLGHIDALQVNPLPLDESLALLMEPFPSLQDQEDEKAAATELVTDFLHNLPVAILAVSGLVRHKKWTFKGYRKRLEEKQVEAGADSVRKVLQDALAEARKESNLARVLDVAAFVGRDNTPLSLLENEELVEQVCALNLLQVTMDRQYSIHGLIQEAAQVGRSPRDAIVMLGRALERFDRDAPDTWPAAVAILPHVQALRRVATVDYGLINLSVCDIEDYSRLFHNCGIVYETVLCQFGFCRVLQKDCLTLEQVVHKETTIHASIAEKLNNLGGVYKTLGAYEQAKKCFKEALTMLQVVYKETTNHVSIAKTLSNLGYVYRSLGDYVQSKKYYEKALIMFRAVYGEKTAHTSIAKTLSSVGCVYRLQGDYEKSKKFYGEALAMFRALYRETINHASIAKTLDSLGNVCTSLGDYEQSKKYHEEASAMIRVLLKGQPATSTLLLEEAVQGKVQTAVAN